MKHKPHKVRGKTEYYRCIFCGKDVKVSDERVNESFAYSTKDGYYHLKCLRTKVKL